MEKKIEETIGLIDEKQLTLDGLFEELTKVKEEVHSVDDQLSEVSALLVKYKALKTQYQADLSRLQLTIEWQLHSDELGDRNVCPFCSGRLEKSLEESFAEAAKAELLKLAPKIRILGKQSPKSSGGSLV